MYGRDTKIKILNNEETLNLGAVYENVVAQELKAHGFDTFYFRQKKLGELDFVVEKGGSILPLEVKSGKSYKKHSALNSALATENFNFGKAYVLNNNNVENEGHVRYVPVYMTMFLWKDEEKLPVVDIGGMMFVQ